jgi:hypothetical protein
VSCGMANRFYCISQNFSGGRLLADVFSDRILWSRRSCFGVCQSSDCRVRQLQIVCGREKNLHPANSG